MFTWDSIAGLLRQLLPFLGGFAVSRGWINADQLTQVVGAIITIGGVVWALLANTKSSIAQSVGAMQEAKVTTQGSGVKIEITDPKIAAAVKKGDEGAA